MTTRNRRRVIVTGGAGFIGSHTVVELCEAGFAPVVVDDFSNSKQSVIGRLAEITGADVRCHAVDCGDREALREVFESEGEVFGAIHFAASKAVGESVRRPLDYYRNNVGSLLSLLDLMLEFGVGRLVFSSSCTVYGQPDALPVTENSPTQPAASPYGATKQVCESVLRDSAAAALPLASMILRYFNPIGAHPGSRIGELPLGPPENLVPFVTQTAIGLRDRLTVFGDDYETPDGSCVRDYIHVVDLARAHVAALDWLDERGGEPLVETLNIGTGEGMSVLQIVKAFERVSGRRLEYQIGKRRAGDVARIYADVTRSREVLGWFAERSIEDAIRDAWNWELALAAERSAKT